MGFAIFDEHKPLNVGTTIDDSVGTAAVELVQGGDTGSRLDSVHLVSTAATDHEVEVIIDTGVAYVAVTLTVPAGAGMSGAVPPVEVVTAWPTSVNGILVASGSTLKLRCQLTLIPTETITAIAVGGSF